MVEDSVLINSSKHLESLLSDLKVNEEMEYDFSSENMPDTNNSSERHHVELERQKRLDFDIMTVDRSDEKQDDESLSSNSPHEEEIQNDFGHFSSNFIDSSGSKRVDRNGNDDDNNEDNEGKYELNYNELRNDYEYYKNTILKDSLDLDGMRANEELSVAHNKPGANFKQNSKVLNNEDETPKRRESHLVPKFRYKEPKSRFLEKNKIDLSKAKQTSYTKKYMNEKYSGKNKQNKMKNGYANPNDEHMKNDNSKTGFEMHSNRNQMPLSGYEDASSLARHMDVSGGRDEMGYLRENIEISRLDEMIKEEENNLQNNVLTLPWPQPYAQLQYPEVESLGYHHNHNQLDVYSDYSRTLPNHQAYTLSGISKTSEYDKRASYAEIHSVLPDRHAAGDDTSSYAAKHLEKKSPHNYKMYSLKEYRDLNKDIKLQKSLGPDISSTEYLEKKAKAEKKKDYASAVAAHNQQHVKTKKVRSAPAPSSKDRAKESRRIAALEYAKNVNNLAKKRPKPKVRQRPATDDRNELSALDIMKQRHEAEKKAIDEMRKNLAGIIRG